MNRERRRTLLVRDRIIPDIPGLDDSPKGLAGVDQRQVQFETSPGTVMRESEHGQGMVVS